MPAASPVAAVKQAVDSPCHCDCNDISIIILLFNLQLLSCCCVRRPSYDGMEDNWLQNSVS